LVMIDFNDLPTVAQVSQLDGTIYLAASLEVILLFGQTELRAQVAWKENVSPFNP
jgi:hypothetical protein